jgi:flavin-dependent dehydrogenase
MYDAIIVGARCAGSPLAMLLARQGYKILLVDRNGPPADTISTHIVWPPGVRLLREWGLLEALRRSGCPALRTARLDLGDIVIRGTPAPIDGIDEWYAPRRTALDPILLEAAVAAGADFQAFTVDELLFDDGRVTGIRGHRRDAAITERGKIVIGADGVRSAVARAVRAPEYNDRGTLTCWYYSYWSGVEISGIEFYARPRYAVGGIPTHDGLVCVAVARPHAEFDAIREDVEANYLAALDVVPEFAARVRAGKREERFSGTAEVPNYFRRPYGDGWALAGDAGYHKDPVTAYGITDAFESAGLLAAAVDDGLAGRRSMMEALADYERRRNEAAMAAYDITCQFATLEPPPPEMQPLFQALARNQDAANQYLGVLARTVAAPEFFAPENLARITGQASRPASA